MGKTPNRFGVTVVGSAAVGAHMLDYEALGVERTGAPSDRPTETMDVRELGPPAPLRETLEFLADADDRQVLVQVNDRAPRHLYPKLDDRGYEYETVEGDDAVVTAVWRAD